MIVGSGCAGLNFMTIAFSTFYFAFLHRVGRGARRAAWLAASIVAAYLLTVATNAIRVLVTTSLYGMDIYGPQVTPRRLHALAGVSIYATSLVLAVLVAGRLIDGSGPRSRRVLAALGTYLAFVIAVPLATRAGLDDPRRFIEHSAMAVTVCALLAAAAGARRRRRRASGRPLG
jgi:exosortase/archaeosortase family protein